MLGIRRKQPKDDSPLRIRASISPTGSAVFHRARTSSATTLPTHFTIPVEVAIARKRGLASPDRPLFEPPRINEGSKSTFCHGEPGDEHIPSTGPTCGLP